LPITRVKKIYFTSKERKEQTITNINMSTAFIPDELVEIKGDFDDVPTDKLEKSTDIANPNNEEQIKKFDKYLGGLALMRLAGEEYMNYSENYFATLSLFNSVIQRDFDEYSKVKPYYRYRGAFKGTDGFEKIMPYLNKTIDETDIISIAQEENQSVKKQGSSRIIDLNSLKNWTYTIAVLNTYGVGNKSKKKKIDDLILSNFKSDIKFGKSEGIALCYGINRGYSVFSNKYSLNKKEKVVKFQLNSQLDYYTIESLYQYVFNNNVISDEFSYLKEWCPKQKCSKISRKTDYKILDVIVIGKKKAKVLSEEYWQNLLPSFLQSNKLSEKTLPQIYQELGETVYNDTKDEIADDYENQIAQKQEEINQLKTDASNLELQVNQNQKEINKLKSESKSDQDEFKPAEVAQNIPIKEEVINLTAEQQFANTTKTDIKRIVEETLKYKEKNQTMLKSEAKDRGITLPKGIKQDDIIVLLMTTSYSRLKLE
jgi:hypothetical protein